MCHKFHKYIKFSQKILSDCHYTTKICIWLGFNPRVSGMQTNLYTSLENEIMLCNENFSPDDLSEGLEYNTEKISCSIHLDVP